MLTGARLRGELIVRAAGEDVRPVLESVARRLPPEYRAGVGESVNGLRLRADAGEFVSVRGVGTGPGEATFTVDTGCRVDPAGRAIDAASDIPRPSQPELAAALDALARAGDSDGTGSTRWVRCPGTEVSAETAHLFVTGDPVTDPGAALRALRTAGTTVVADETDLYAARTGPVSLVARTVDGRTRLTITRDCAGGR